MCIGDGLYMWTPCSARPELASRTAPQVEVSCMNLGWGAASNCSHACAAAAAHQVTLCERGARCFLSHPAALPCCTVGLGSGQSVAPGPCAMLQAARAAQEEASQSKQDSADLQRDLGAAQAQAAALEGSLAGAQAGLAEAQAAAQQQHQEGLSQRDAAHRELARQLQASQEAVRGLQQGLAQAQVQLAGLTNMPGTSTVPAANVRGGSAGPVAGAFSRAPFCAADFVADKDWRVRQDRLALSASTA